VLAYLNPNAKSLPGRSMVSARLCMDHQFHQLSSNPCLFKQDRSPTIQDLEGFTQTYIVKSVGVEDTAEENEACSREVFCRCGNWCYTGQIKISYQHAFEMRLKGQPRMSCFSEYLSIVLI
jgi:hypothetical protein